MCEYVENLDLIAFKSYNDVLSNMHLHMIHIGMQNALFFYKYETAEQIMSIPSEGTVKKCVHCGRCENSNAENYFLPTEIGKK